MKEENRIWKTPIGKFIQVINPTERDIKILLASGCELIPTAEEYFAQAETISASQE